ncbi:hypothetical protein [Polycladidibacter hongkongensis]|uniref:hypothetical protein n=1 Tax=Polycladidibacter hongkongensis TaxID=1647556 RepID=UPI000B0B503B|nr:hypothetical protein [Pseudovibrio hongkongensis]
MLTIAGAKHGLGGIAGYDAAETEDEDPDRLAVVQRSTGAYLRSCLYSDNAGWQEVVNTLQVDAKGLAHIEVKSEVARSAGACGS